MKAAMIALETVVLGALVLAAAWAVKAWLRHSQRHARAVWDLDDPARNHVLPDRHLRPGYKPLHGVRIEDDLDQAPWAPGLITPPSYGEHRDHRR